MKLVQKMMAAGKYTRRDNHMAILIHNKTSFYNRLANKSHKKTLANQDIKLERGRPVFNVRFYYNDGRFYYRFEETDFLR